MITALKMRRWALILFPAIALATAGSIVSAHAEQPAVTHTSLTAETHEVGGHTITTLTATVESQDGAHATGSVTIAESGKSEPGKSESGKSEAGKGIASAALNADGVAILKLDTLTEGNHNLHAVYGGDTARAASESEAVAVHPQVTATPDFGLAIAPASMTLKAGASGSLVLSVTPLNGFTGFLSLSCSGLPYGTACTYTPANLQITAPGTVTADLSIVTTAPAGQKTAMQSSKSPLTLALLLPGIAGLVFAKRKRNLLGRAALIAFLGVISIAGMTACAARYRYLNHPPTYNGGTPLGTYSLSVTGQTSNGVNATEHSIPLALTVN